MTYFSNNLEILKRIVKKSGMGLIRDFNELSQLQSAPKGHDGFANAAVERTMHMLKMELSRYRHDLPIITKAEELTNGSCFVVSPLNGQLNFMRSIPYFAISVAVMNKDEILSAVVYNPATGDTFFAEKGYGAFKEGNRSHLRLRVSSRNDLASSLVVSNNPKVLANVAEANVRRFGAVSLDLAAVAAGQIDGLQSDNEQLADIAAGMLLVREAGGVILSAKQKDVRSEDMKTIWKTGSIIAGNPIIGKKLFELA